MLISGLNHNDAAEPSVLAVGEIRTHVGSMPATTRGQLRYARIFHEPGNVVDMRGLRADGSAFTTKLKLPTVNLLAESQYRLGYAYLYGLGIERDPATAEKWLPRAGDNGSEDGLYWLG